MKSLLPISSLLVLLGSASAFAADLNIPMSFEYLALDGKKVESSVFNHKSSLELTPGTHKIAIRYHEMVEDDFSDSQTFVKSAPFIVTLDVDGDYQYYLQAAEGKVVKKPKVYAQNPQIKLTRSDKGNVNYQVVNTNLEEESFVSRLFSGNQAVDVSGTAAAATGAAGAVVAVAPAPVATSATVSATSLTAPVDTSKATAANPQQMLQYWWLQADEKTRKEFMSWAISQL
ncbi:DUF2057 domain-containing protein [Shewanella sp. SW36]|uniref:UPF0319 protein NE536_22270 n=1 Tax=Shewanella septentrionalis TaxID=2952223 RepID=A0A9X2WZ01_9GAMM|nr:MULTISPECIES: DUF2057 domain-containing protein [Shewanella]MCT7948075.1 DUF2057 domain-containing protein [Shewanella septentrionalis]MCU7975446.1 DUF2057 domain-containing protein [Shewanella sp. SW36]MCU7990836.1 DUF2057 domain-containing protein [Shewanella sp. SW1]MCU8017068.1 DUF2057 domain-containing protein [Shewanella sp. SM72]MCU8050513.1 DUF2057 domain-containing protein [Shewanella sp. SM43]